MPAPITVEDLVDQVRQQIDEANTVQLPDSDILNALNRAQDYASDLLVRHYPEPLLATGTQSLTAGTQGYDMPEDIFEDKLQRVEVVEGSNYYPVKRINYRQVADYESSSTVSRPQFYYIMGKQWFLLPTPSGGTVRYWYLKELESLVLPQGRITNVDTSNNRVTVDAIGSDLATASTSLNNYVNIIDASSGELKASYQIQSIDTTNKRITFRSTPTRSTVLNRTITGTVSSTTTEVDDYICVSRGNCIPYLKKPLSNYLIQYAVVELRRRLGEPSEADERALEKMEEQVKRQWAGRETQHRVTKASKNWSGRYKRNFFL